MKLLMEEYNPDREKIDSMADIVIEKLKDYIQGTPVEFLKTKQLKAEIEMLPQNAKIEIIYSIIKQYSDVVASESICEQKEMKSSTGGCKFSLCCKLKPDVFSFEKERLDVLPSSPNKHTEYCRFFDFRQSVCSVYQYRPFACRIFTNFENDSKYCIEACRDTKSLKNVVFIFVEPFLGAYVGPYIGT